MDNVVAYALAEGVNLEGLEGHLINQGLYTIGQMPQGEKIICFCTDTPCVVVFFFYSIIVLFISLLEMSMKSFMTIFKISENFKDVI